MKKLLISILVLLFFVDSFAQINISIAEDTIFLRRKKTINIPLTLNIKTKELKDSCFILYNFFSDVPYYHYDKKTGLRFFSFNNHSNADYRLSGLSFPPNTKKIKKQNCQKQEIIIFQNQKKQVNINIKERGISTTDTSFIFFIYTQQKQNFPINDTINCNLFEGEILSDTVIVILRNKFSLFRNRR